MENLENMSATSRKMPDITKSRSVSIERSIDKVGMSDIEVSLLLGSYSVPAQSDVYVSLSDPKSKGIHMSRLYLALTKDLKSNVLSEKTFKDLLKKLIEEQEGISSEAYIKVSFELPLMRKALVSQTKGERHYPVEINVKAVRDEKGKYSYFSTVGFKVLYSSTCPCSAALARQLIEENWIKHSKGRSDINFQEVADWLRKEESIVATPHAQRSEAHVKLRVESFSTDLFEQWISTIEEKVLKTPVQTAVKREDEQEFARLNGTNLMFCEDAARKVSSWLDSESGILDYWARMEHRESLHSHNAVSEISKNGSF